MQFSYALRSMRSGQAAKTAAMLGFVKMDSATAIVIDAASPNTSTSDWSHRSAWTARGYDFSDVAAPTESTAGVRYRVSRDYFTFVERGNKTLSAYAGPDAPAVSEAAASGDPESYCYLRLTVVREMYDSSRTISSETAATEWRTVSLASGAMDPVAPSMALDPQLLAEMLSDDWSVLDARVAQNSLSGSGANRW